MPSNACLACCCSARVFYFRPSAYFIAPLFLSCYEVYFSLHIVFVFVFVFVFAFLFLFVFVFVFVFLFVFVFVFVSHSHHEPLPYCNNQ